MPNNKTVLVSSWNHSICAYSIEYGRTSHVDEAHRDAISCMDWNRGILATGSWDATVKVLWNCPPKNTFTDLNYDLKLAENRELTDAKRDELYKFAIEDAEENTYMDALNQLQEKRDVDIRF